MRKPDQRCVASQHMNQMSNIEAARGDRDGSYRPRDPVASGNIPKFEGTRAETGFDRECASSNEITASRFKTSHRQLEQLTIYYLLLRSEQLLFGGPSEVLSWQAASAGLSVPRPLVFIDLPKTMKFIPMAAEFVHIRMRFRRAQLRYRIDTRKVSAIGMML